ncbi:FecR family protein [Paremcibacter congregatus]|uniref:Uncharacterized protein n=1 Tax=Paremcibacter congregatus TaxID=2043170 RepID=A0A2G4YWM1_9PROT|nr:FecR domain-containing protein [Paremcibacter congregatus]PHZ86742.1 hypothetical protein CRD36_00130 [Paremcibacter congregatus]QDE26258.1 DUF4974 domain-containing protein [Paremcibacter congregatus]
MNSRNLQYPDPLEAKTADVIREEASRWAALTCSEELPADLKVEFENWKAADVRHISVYEDMFSLMADFSKIDGLSEMAEHEGPLSMERFLDGLRDFKSTTKEWARPIFWDPAKIGAIAAMGMLIIFGLSAAYISSVIWPSTNSYITQVAELKEVTLPDGSIITLGAMSKLTVQFSDNERRVFLNNGEAFFSIEKDAKRPFYVVTEGTEVRVVGTKFDVRRGVTGIQVAVLKGVVQVVDIENREEQKKKPSMQTKILHAGEKITDPYRGDIKQVEKITGAMPGAWRQGRLVYASVRLADLVADANRYYKGKIVINDSAIADLSVSISFRADQIEEMLESLSVTLPIKVVSQMDRENNIVNFIISPKRANTI